MGIFGKNAQQKRIDADAVVIAGLRQTVLRLESQLAQRNLELIRVRSEKVTVGKLADELLKERDDTRVELKVFTDRWEKGKLNLKQYRTPAKVANGSVEGRV